MMTKHKRKEEGRKRRKNERESRTSESYGMRPNYLKYTQLESKEEERIKGKRRGVERPSSRGRRRETGREKDRGRIVEKRYLKR